MITRPTTHSREVVWGVNTALHTTTNIFTAGEQRIGIRRRHRHPPFGISQPKSLAVVTISGAMFFTHVDVASSFTSRWISAPPAPSSGDMKAADFTLLANSGRNHIARRSLFPHARGIPMSTGEEERAGTKIHKPDVRRGILALVLTYYSRGGSLLRFYPLVIFGMIARCACFKSPRALCGHLRATSSGGPYDLRFGRLRNTVRILPSKAIQMVSTRRNAAG